MQSVEEYHASYMSIHGWPRLLLEENRPIINRINQRMGYRLQLRQLQWPRQVNIGKPFEVESQWANAGVAPCYPGGFMTITLKDDKGGIVAALADESMDMRNLQVGAEGRAPITTHKSRLTAGLVAPVTKPGTYDLFVSVGRRDGTPVIALPLPEDDGQHRYKIGQVELLP